eukprot:NODE_9292_length_375_cov_10.800613_g8389_i0.p2 GENE.NODE_9292_length_375_cov_10.800613_g8389_i0~~NODE_9292_length_375_cov_10.800613_g8389_i0.p2  ORF type:complete len:69 (-),score=0.73 NODE_9292_length_375_cov_10.800613_g8389_i0:139-345(-)
MGGGREGGEGGEWGMVWGGIHRPGQARAWVVSLDNPQAAGRGVREGKGKLHAAVGRVRVAISAAHYSV